MNPSMKYPCLALLAFSCALPLAAVRADDGASTQTTQPTQTAATAKRHHHEKHSKHSLEHKASKFLARYDADGNGKLDHAELTAMLAAHHKCHRHHAEASSERPPKSAQVALDSSSKASRKATKLLKKYDANGDGMLDRQELAKMMKDRKSVAV